MRRREGETREGRGRVSHPRSRGIGRRRLRLRSPKFDQSTGALPLSAQGEVVTPTVESEESLRPQHIGQNSERSDKLEYERLLRLFRDGDLDGARQGFAVFLRDYGNSDLSPMRAIGSENRTTAKRLSTGDRFV